MPRIASGQLATASWTVQAQNVRLDDALRVFSSRTGSAVAYDPNITRGIRISCGIRDARLEDYLGCLLAGSGLEFFRRASGTYVIGPTLVLPDRYGLVSGTVRDSNSGEVIRSAHVTLAGVNRGSISGPGGGFLVPDLLPGRYSVSVTHVGYLSWRDSVDVLAGGRTELRAALAPATYTLDPVVVQQSGTSLLPRQDPDRVIRGSIRSSGPTSSMSDMTSRIHIQGSDAGDVRLRLDGSPVYLPREFATFIGPFSRSAIAGVRLSTAGFGAGDGSLLGGALDFEQRVRRDENVSVSLNPIALDASVSGTHAGPHLSTTNFLAAARIGLWDRFQPTELARTVASWSKTDPFLLFGPIRDYSRVTEESVRGLFDLAPVVPDLQFSDVHGTIEHETSSGQSWRFSLYTARRGLSGDRRNSDGEINLASDGPFVSSVAAHDWSSTTATASWRGLVGDRTLAEVVAYGSLYDYRHEYALAEQVDVTFAGDRFEGVALAETETVDGNSLEEFSLRVRIDQSRGNHALSAGSEAIVTSSQFDLRLSSLEGGESIEVVTPNFAVDGSAASFDTTSVFLVRHGTVGNESRAFRVSAWVADRLDTERFSAEVSARFTIRPDRKTLYAEPRARAAWRAAPDLVLALSGGLYRQFVNQFDFSSVNAGEFVPSARIWLPLDRSIRPGRAVHVAFDLDWTLSPAWGLTAAAYAKRVDGGLVINYGLEPGLIVDGTTLSQNQLLTRRDARHVGLSVAAQYLGRANTAGLSYRFARDRVTSRELFGGRWLPAPWEVPHRLKADWSRPLAYLTVSLVGVLEAGQTWALRQVYYDYFGQREETRLQPGWDLGRPDQHALPVRMTLDLGASYDWQVQAAKLQVRLEVQNLAGRKNQIDERLLWDGSQLVGDPRHLPGRTVMIGVQAAW